MKFDTEEPKNADGTPGATLPLSHGRILSVGVDASSSDRIVIRSSTGEMELAIDFGPDGPRLRLRAIDIELAAAKRLALQCESFELQVAESANLNVSGALQMRGGDIYLDAPRGELSLKANDDLIVRGERILLNSDAEPMPASLYDGRTRGNEPPGEL